jgi:hypothetical protein
MLQEVVDRARRIETRQAKHLTALGFETGVRKPVWEEGTIDAPSPAISLLDCIATIPPVWDDELEVPVLFRGRLLGYVLKA